MQYSHDAETQQDWHVICIVIGHVIHDIQTSEVYDSTFVIVIIQNRNTQESRYIPNWHPGIVIVDYWIRRAGKYINVIKCTSAVLDVLSNVFQYNHCGTWTGNWFPSWIIKSNQIRQFYSNLYSPKSQSHCFNGLYNQYREQHPLSTFSSSEEKLAMLMEKKRPF